MIVRARIGFRWPAVRLLELSRLLQLVWCASSEWNAVWLGLLLLQGLLPIGMVHLTRVFVDRLAGAAGRASVSEIFSLLLAPASALLAAVVVSELIAGLQEWVRTARSEAIQDHIAELVHAKSLEVDLAFYESPEFHDRLHRARSDSATRPLALLDGVGGMLQNGITLAGMAAVLIPYGVWLPLILVLSTAPAFLVVIRSNRLFHQWWENSTADRRWVQYYDQTITGSWPAAELRLFDLGSHFRAAYKETRRRLRSRRLEIVACQSRARLLSLAITLTLSSASLAWMMGRVAHGSCTLGDLALFYQAFVRGQSLMRAMLGGIGQTYGNSLFLSNLFAFLALKPSITTRILAVAAPETPRHGIRFCNVTFRYPGCRRAALRNFHLEVSAGSTVAIVGSNGAGKSTLIKLLCRFYDPEEGSILLDGVDLRQMPVADLRRLVSAQFQLPVGYHSTARDNIAFGDLSRPPIPWEIQVAAQAAGAESVISKLPEGYSSLLGRWFAQGSELSAGEWQRIATARALYRRSPILILDEPTSFIDSWSEAEWWDRIHPQTAGRTVIVVTHRLALAMRADRIHVMREGSVAESGSHGELMARGGLYAASWNSQNDLGLVGACHLDRSRST